MPVVGGWSDDGEPVLRYLWPARYVDATDESNATIRSWRKQAVADQEAFLRHQKASGADREAAKFFKAEAAHHLRLQRACTLALPWLGEPDANQEPTRPLLWPVDLAPEMDEIAGRIVLAFG